MLTIKSYSLLETDFRVDIESCYSAQLHDTIEKESITNQVE